MENNGNIVATVCLRIGRSLLRGCGFVLLVVYLLCAYTFCVRTHDMNTWAQYHDSVFVMCYCYGVFCLFSFLCPYRISISIRWIFGGWRMIWNWPIKVTATLSSPSSATRAQRKPNSLLRFSPDPRRYSRIGGPDSS